MKNFRTSAGPFSERPYFKLSEIERMCDDELRKLQLYPVTPEPVRIDRFVEKRFNVDPSYEELPPGVLGFTKFGKQGVAGIVISRALDEEGTKAANRRIRTTLSHEAGHGLLHTHLFAMGIKPLSLFEGETSDVPEILCRDTPDTPGPKRGYDGRWWEYQANQVMGCLLMPRRLVLEATQPFIVPTGALGMETLEPARREEAAQALADLFDVNPAAVRIRLKDIFPVEDNRQLAF
jgi:hypothetical protein